jgi:hypothetical protein
MKVMRRLLSLFLSFSLILNLFGEKNFVLAKPQKPTPPPNPLEVTPTPTPTVIPFETSENQESAETQDVSPSPSQPSSPSKPGTTEDTEESSEPSAETTRRNTRKILKTLRLLLPKTPAMALIQKTPQVLSKTMRQVFPRKMSLTWKITFRLKLILVAISPTTVLAMQKLLLAMPM